MNNILLFNFGGIGDEILFLPAIISLKKQFPNAKITLALEPRSKGITSLVDIIDDTILVDIKGKNKYFELLKLILESRKGNFDAVISAGGNKFIAPILFFTGIKKRYGFDVGALSRILLTKAVKLNKQQYACDMYHELVTPLTEVKTELPQIKIKSTEKIANSVLIHPGVSKMSINKGMIKTIEANQWAEIIDELVKSGKHVILAGGPDDKEVVEIIRSTSKEKFEDYYGKTKSLADLAQLIGKAEKFVCSDSAPLHIAVAMKIKTYVVFGPTDEKKLIPQSDIVIPLKSKNKCDLQPCLWDRRQTTCQNLDCLKFGTSNIIELILKD